MQKKLVISTNGFKPIENQDTQVNQEPTMLPPLDIVKSKREPIQCTKEFSDIVQNSNLSQAIKDLLIMAVSLATTSTQREYFEYFNPEIISVDKVNHLVQNRTCGKKYRMALVTVTNGVTPNIQEWIVWYLMLGVSKIYFYDDSIPNSLAQQKFHQALAPFQKLGLVELFPVHGLNMTIDQKQMTFYGRFMEAHKNEFDWVALFDGDEYLSLNKHECLDDLLGDYADYAGLVVQWRMVHFLGVPVHDTSKTHFDQYHYCIIDVYNHVKSIVQPKHVNSFQSMHFAVYNQGQHAVNTFNDRIDGPFNLKYANPFEIAEIRHFFMEGLASALFERICGEGRKIYMKQRTNQFIDGIKNPTVFKCPDVPKQNEFANILYGR
jgi:hypothetical protein